MKTLLCFVILACGMMATAQDLRLPDASPEAMVMQEVGISKVTISYSSPAVNGREIWGNLVPYGMEKSNPFGHGKPMPWRAGANENTTITLTHDAKIEGQILKAGTYSIHMIPETDQWVIIFNNNYTSWGSFFYEESEDALRVTVKPQMMADSQDRLSYGFDNTDRNKTIAYLRWEKIKVAFTISFDTPQIVLNYIRQRLKNREAWDHGSLSQAAQFALRNNSLDEALSWTDRAINSGGGTSAFFLKSIILDKQGKKTEADAIKKRAIDNATEADLNTFGYQLLGQGKAAEAVEVFRANAKKFPDSWNVYDSLGDGLEAIGDKKGAIDSFTKAQKMVKDDANKKRIGDTLKRLQDSK